MIQKVLRNPLFYIFLVALALRLYHISIIPNGFHVDEVKVGWNAYSILKTGADDWGDKWNLHYNSFGDFRPKGIIYFTIPFIALFGLNEFATRLPAAVIGALLTIPLYYFTLYLTKKRTLALFASFFTAISPWGISLSRATSEAIIAVTLVIAGLAFLLKYLKTEKNISLVLSFLLLFPSYFFYHSARLLVPILTTSVAYYYYYDTTATKTTFKKLLKTPPIILCVALFICSIFFATASDSRQRFSQVSIFNDLDIKTMRDQFPFEDGQGHILAARVFHNKIALYSIEFIQQYTKYFSPAFLIAGAGNPIRYKTVGNGAVLFVEFPLFVLGIAAILRKKMPSLPLLLLLIAPLPAALTTEDVPNLSRAAFMIPFLSILIAYGFTALTKFKWKLIVSVVLFLNMVYFLHMYFVHNKIHEPIPLNRNVGVKEAVLHINDLKNEYDIVYITNIPDSLYPWYAFYNKVDPFRFNEVAKTRDKGTWTFENITFGQIKCPSRDVHSEDYPNKKILFIDAEGCDTNPEIVKLTKVLEVKRPAGGTVYTFWTN